MYDNMSEAKLGKPNIDQAAFTKDILDRLAGLSIESHGNVFREIKNFTKDRLASESQRCQQISKDCEQFIKEFLQ